MGQTTAHLTVELPGGGDVSVFATVRKLRNGRQVGSEDSYGYPRRRDDPRHAERLAPGEVVDLEIALAPSATLFRAGEQLRVEITGHWPTGRNPVTG